MSFAGYIYAILAAVLFGASTPAAKWLLADASPWLLAGLLYLGSGIGLFIARLSLRILSPSRSEAPIRGRQWFWLLGATLFGGVIAPVFLMYGLAGSDAATGALLLNTEGVFTALLAWFVFEENFDRRIFLGMVLILAGGALLSWGGFSTAAGLRGPGFIALACIAWAADNNLTKKIADGDAMQIAMIKGLVAGLTNTLLALGFTKVGLATGQVMMACVVGFLGYGVSLLCFVLALRSIGAARTGAYFSLAPFVGAGIALIAGDAVVTWQLAGAGGLMAIGVWLHLTERHSHEHTHECMEHEHSHVHDEHHDHQHTDLAGQGEATGPLQVKTLRHSHRHRHEKLTHSHAHFPDAHHLHSH